ncbi:hypothetical protein BLOT_006592 [Blomia tropicalis]|nr:hypothetical protein BLOT_006592 [Blomia tropicalis]
MLKGVLVELGTSFFGNKSELCTTLKLTYSPWSCANSRAMNVDKRQSLQQKTEDVATTITGAGHL